MCIYIHLLPNVKGMETVTSTGECIELVRKTIPPMCYYMLTISYHMNNIHLCIKYMQVPKNVNN